WQVRHRASASSARSRAAPSNVCPFVRCRVRDSKRHLSYDRTSESRGGGRRTRQTAGADVTVSSYSHTYSHSTSGQPPEAEIQEPHEMYEDEVARIGPPSSLPHRHRFECTTRGAGRRANEEVPGTGWQRARMRPARSRHAPRSCIEQCHEAPSHLT